MCIEEVTVTIPNNSGPATTYPILIGSGILELIAPRVGLDAHSSLFIVADSKIDPRFVTALQGLSPDPLPTLAIDGDESCKELTNLSGLWTIFQAAKLDRNSLVIAMGGGAVLDLVGFAASTYMRGMSYLPIPTTLLSQVDASIGGKNGINFGGVKNLVGSFAQPIAVVIDTETLGTLPERELRSGLAEMVKHSCIADRGYLDELFKIELSDLSSLITPIKRSCEIKAGIVSSDPLERGSRKLLNFGHTIGHALESLYLKGTSPLLHGEAVSIGMIAEAKLAEKMQVLEPQELAILKSSLEKLGLPVKCRLPFDVDAAMTLIHSDKKNVGGDIRWSLITAIGKGVYDVSVDGAAVVATLIEIQQ